MNELNQLAKLALEIRLLHQRCQELSEFLRQETSWLNQLGTAHQLKDLHERWLGKLDAYRQFSSEYSPKCSEEELWTIVYLNKLVDDHSKAK